MRPAQRTMWSHGRTRGRSAARLLGTVAAIAVALWASAPPAGAQFAGERVQDPLTDRAGVLSGAEEEAAERALASSRARGIDLHVLLVDDTGGRNATSYAEEVATASSMGGNDALLVVAFGERSFALWAGDALDASPSEINAILDRFVAPELRAGDVAGAVAAASDGLARARAGRGEPSGTSVRGFGAGLLLPFLVVGLLLFLLVRFLRRSLARAMDTDVVLEDPQAPGVDAGQLGARVNAQLLRVDDALRDAEHEAGYAEAQFGAEEAAAFRRGLEQARVELQSAFHLRQRLDDDEPESYPEHVALLEAVERHTRAADAIVGERLERLEQLRGLERDPSTATQELRVRMDAVEERLPAAEATLAELRTGAPAVVPAVDGNLAEARKRLAFSAERVQAAAGAAAPEAAQALRAAGAALAQAEQLLDAVDDLAERVRRARRELPQELQEAELALARAEDLVLSRRHMVGRVARTRLVEARRKYGEAETAAATDPATATAAAQVAERLADEAFELALGDSESRGDDDSRSVQGFGWGLPIPIPIPFPFGGGIGFGGTSWGSFGGGTVGGGSFGEGSTGGGRW